MEGGRDVCFGAILPPTPAICPPWAVSTIAGEWDHFPAICKDESFIVHLLWWSDRVVTTGMARGALVGSQTCPGTGFARARMCQQAHQAFPHPPNPQIIYRGEMGGQVWRMIDGRWLASQLGGDNNPEPGT